MITIDSHIPPPSSTFGITEPSNSSQQIASGKRLNSAQDDPGSLAIATQLSAEIISQGQYSRNINDGVSMVEVADASLQQSSEITFKMQELAQQAANSTLSHSQRTLLQEQFAQLQDELRQVHQNSVFGDNQLLSENGTTQIQVGASQAERIPVIQIDLNEQLTEADFFAANIATPEAATNSLTTLAETNQLITRTRTELGATQNRLEVRANTIENNRIETIQSRGRITDADIAMAVPVN